MRVSAPSASALEPMRASDVPPLLAALSRLRPACYLDALDLTPSTLDLGDNAALWQRAGLARERRIFVSRMGDELVAAAVAELAEEGAHLFRLLDIVRVYSFSREGDERLAALVLTAGQWFSSRGKERFILFREEQTKIDLSDLNVVQELGPADMSILNAALLPELLEHTSEVTSPAEGRHERG